jgi:protein-disulfide isomerase
MRSSPLKPHKAIIAILTLSFCILPARGQQGQAAAPTIAPGAPPQIQKKVEAYLRDQYALGPDVAIKVGALKETGIEGLQETDIEVKSGDNKESVKFYISKDAKYLFRGELVDLSKDSLAETRQKLQTKDAPSTGDPRAPVTLVEFSDFECPVCRTLHDVLRGLLPNYPQVRVVFKDYPIEQIHPWARTAALAGRCAYQQEPRKFWQVYDLIYDSQEVISAENAWGKMVDYAGQAGLNQDAFKSCMASPEAGAAVDASRTNGLQLEVSSTPTVFINGRRLVGADAHLLEQYIKYELDQQKTKRAN